ncbi:MAG: site-specific integrase [Solirubrobacterales bacterium]|nr:site-specific integrase [Solirubrobacterales bacterium]
MESGGRHHSPATTGGFHAERSPHNKGQHYPADPPTVDEIQEALSLIETDLISAAARFGQHGKNDRRREVGMDAWARSAIEPRLADRTELPVRPLFCLIDGPTRGLAWSARAARIELHRVAFGAAVRRRFASHQLRHTHAVELLHEGISLPLIQRQLGHSHLSIAGTISRASTPRRSSRRSRAAAPMHASAGLAL